MGQLFPCGTLLPKDPAQPLVIHGPIGRAPIGNFRVFEVTFLRLLCAVSRYSPLAKKKAFGTLKGTSRASF